VHPKESLSESKPVEGMQMSLTVVIPAYNRESLILPTLDSVRLQSAVATEVLVIDDCSKDRTVEVIREYIDLHPYFPLRLIQQTKNQGVSAARNRGIQEATGHWIAFLDSDDLWEINHLEGLLAEAKTSNADIVFAKARGYSDNDPNASNKTWTTRFKNANEVVKAMVSACHILPSATMVQKNVFLKHGCFDETSAIQHAEDWDLWLRLGSQGCVFAMRNAFTCLYRQHEGSACRDKSRLYRAIVFCLKKNYGKSPATLSEWNKSLHYYLAKLGKALFAAGQTGASEALFKAWQMQPIKATTFIAALLCLMSKRLKPLYPLTNRFIQRFI
jgi:teichuronic acid biosynthesis glycosyltransferase TuaG